MAQSTMRTLAPSPLLTASTRAWSIGSAAAILAAIVLGVMTFAIERFGATVWGLLSAIAVLCIMALAHARFLFLARDQGRQTSELLSNTDREFQSIFEHALDAILVLDDEGVCESANPSASALLSSNLIVGRRVREFYANQADFDALWSRLQVDHSFLHGFQGEAQLIRADGATVFTEFTATAHFAPNRHLMILRDVTRSQRAQQAASESLKLARSSWQEAEALRRASIALSEDLRMNRALATLVETLAQFVPDERAQLYLVEADRRLFLAHEDSQAYGLGFPETLDIAEFPILGKVLASREGLLVEDVLQEPSWRPPAEESPVRCWIGVPIVAQSQVLGLLSLAHSRPHELSSNHLALVRSLAAPAAVAIQNARLYEHAEIYGAELERRIEELRQFEEGHCEPDERFEKIFDSVPVAIYVSTLVEGRFLAINHAFERSFGFTREETDLGLWEDLRERTKLIDRLGRGASVLGAVARFRQKSGSSRETMYSAARIELDGQPCLVIAADDHSGSNK